MNEEQKHSGEKKKWCKILTGLILSVTAIYLTLFAVRFIQLNFVGKHRLFTTQIPESMYSPYIDGGWEGHYLPEDWEKLQISVQFVDFNWDFKTDIIIHSRDMIFVAEPADDGTWKTIADVVDVSHFLYLPFSIRGNPIVLRLKECNSQKGLFVKMY